ncbi:MAG: GTP cyclohydrolase II [Anaerolineales bacterium]|nr:GTP cyclohydrolase II [Anaerolineales bacterium]
MNGITVQKMACARLPTAMGTFSLCLYHNSYENKEHLALVMGDVDGQDDVLVRVHSECFTGDVLGSHRCDCGPQLERAMELIAAEGQGVIVYLRQEGRGIGLLDKLRAYNLQDKGYDTVDANLLLGHQADARDYTIAALILRDLGIHSMRLLTNNPLKIESLQALGLVVHERVPLYTEVTNENAAYLATKVAKMRHMLNLDLLPIHQSGLSVDAIATVNGRSPTPQRPFVTISYAQSLDGSITSRRGQPTALSSHDSMAFTHKLRATHDAILVGIGTVLADDPLLTVRLVEGKHPQPIILDSQLRLPLQAGILQHPTHTPWIVASETAVQERQTALEAAGARVLRVPTNANGQIDLTNLLARLRLEGVNTLMVEGGARVITNFLAQQLVDRVVVTIAPVLVGGLHAVETPHSLPKLPRLHHVRYQRLDDDLVFMGDIDWSAA